MKLDDIRSGLHEFGLDAIAEKLTALAAPSIRVFTHPTALNDIPVGASRLGGVPDVPQDFQWPSELSFIGQINLAEAAVFDREHVLPTAGMLYFFYDDETQPWGFDPENKDGFKVIYVDSTARINRAAPLQGVKQFNPCTLEYQQDWTMPALDSRSILMTIWSSQPEREKYLEFRQEYDTIQNVTHRLLGYPDQLQNEMQLECQLVTNGLYCGDLTGYRDPRAKELEPGADNWRLLLQVDTDDNLGTLWGDVGFIYYWIRKDDLAQRRFDSTWLILQCG